MIKINNGVPAFIATGSDTMTSKKVALLTVDYQTSLTQEEVDGKMVNVGKVGSWLFDEQQTNVMGVQKMQNLDEFKGKDILATLTTEYIATLKALNPKVEFTDTLVVAK